MLFITAVSLTGFFILSTVALMMLGILSYRFLAKAGAKYQAELVLYAALVISGTLCVFWISLIRRSFSRTKAFSGIIDLARISGTLAEDRLATFGSMGKGLKVLFYELTDISEKRGQRLHFMDSLLDIVLAVVTERIFVLDPLGKILYASVKTASEKDSIAADAQGKQITELFPAFDFIQTAARCIQERAEIPIDFDRFAALCIPIYGQNNNADGFVLFLERGNIFASTGEYIRSRSEKKAKKEEKKSGFALPFPRSFFGKK